MAVAHATFDFINQSEVIIFGGIDGGLQTGLVNDAGSRDELLLNESATTIHDVILKWWDW